MTEKVLQSIPRKWATVRCTTLTMLGYNLISGARAFYNGSFKLFRSLSALPVRHGQFSERSASGRHSRDAPPVLELDPPRLHLRDETDRDAHLQVL